jgi:hypothetical protein
LRASGRLISTNPAPSGDRLSITTWVTPLAPI